MVFGIGDQALYGIHGVCRIVDSETRMVDAKQVAYLVLEPVGQIGTRYYIPTHNESAMKKLRKMMTKEEMDRLLQSEEVHKVNWIREDYLRKQTYRDLISGGDRAALMNMVYTLYQHKKTQAGLGKKVHLCDENFLKDAEKLLSSEISIVMGMTFDQARSYVRMQLNEK